jgi:hypothetical protein
VTPSRVDPALPNAPAGQGQWLGRHWRFAEVAPGNTVRLLADNAKVLVETEPLLKAG